MLHKYHRGYTECATEHTKKGIGLKKRGICIPKEFGDDIVKFEKYLEDLRNGKSPKIKN